jgi:putative oxidoreductase
MSTQTANHTFSDTLHTFDNNLEHIFSRLANNAHFLLRLALAGVFVFHGVSKLTDIGMFAGMMNLPYTVALLVALAEIGGGTLVLFGSLTYGWITRLGGAMIIPVMIGAISMVHWGQWNFVPSESHPMGGMEFQVVLLLIALYFVLVGNRK